MKKLVIILIFIFCLSVSGYADSIVSIGQGIRIEPGQNLYGGVLGIGSPVKVEGRVENYVLSVGSSVIVSGNVRGSVIAIGGNIRMLPGGVIQHDAISIGGRVASADKTSVLGEVKELTVGQINITHDRVSLLRQIGELVAFWMKLFSYGLFFFISSLLLTIWPNRYEFFAQDIPKNLWKDLARGLLLMVLGIILLGFFIFSIVGILFVPLVGVIYLLAILIALSISVYSIGAWALRKKYVFGNYLRLAIGALILLVLSFIPVVGLITYTVLCAVGLGVIWRTGFGSYAPRVWEE